MRKEFSPILAALSLFIALPVSAQLGSGWPVPPGVSVEEHNRQIQREREAELYRLCFDQYGDRRSSLDPMGPGPGQLINCPRQSPSEIIRNYRRTRNFTVVNDSDFAINWIEVREYGGPMARLDNYGNVVMGPEVTGMNLNPPLRAGESRTIELDESICNYFFRARTSETGIVSIGSFDTCENGSLVVQTAPPPPEPRELTPAEIEAIRRYWAEEARRQQQRCDAGIDPPFLCD